MSKFRKRLTDNAGFTLIELLVVIAVLGILAGIAIPRLSGVSDKATQAEAKSFLGSVKTSLEMYYLENENSYPTSGSSIETALAGYIDNFDEVTDDWGFSYSYTGEDDFTVTMTHTDTGIGTVVLTKSANGYDITAN